MFTISDLLAIDCPCPEDLLPFYRAAIEANDRDLLAEVDRICGECFSIDAEDLPSFCE